METQRPPEIQKPKTLSIEEARLLISQKKPLPKNAQKDFGPHVNQLPEIINNPELCELDALIISEEIKDGECNQYTMMCPESKETAKKLRALAEFIYKSIANDVSKTVRKVFSKDGRSVKSFNPFYELFNDIRHICQSQEIATMHVNHRSYQLQLLEKNLIEKCSLAIFNNIQQNYGDNSAVFFLQFLRQIKLTTDSNPLKPSVFPGFRAVRDKTGGRAMLQLNPESTKEIFTEMENTEKNFEDEKIFESIEDLSHIKKINRHTFETEHSLITFFNSRRYNPINVIQIIICFDKNRIKAPGTKNRFPIDSSMWLVLDRNSGEILINNTQQTAKNILGEKRYQSLKNFIYQKLLEDLTKAEFEDGSIQNENEEESNSPPTPELAEEKFEVMPSGTQEIQEANETKRAATKIENFHFGNLRSVKGTRILRALRNILGEEKRINGSHHIFVGKNGISVPIPFHGDIPVGIGLLKQSLKTLGVTPEEIYNNL